MRAPKTFAPSCGGGVGVCAIGVVLLLSLEQFLRTQSDCPVVSNTKVPGAAHGLAPVAGLIRFHSTCTDSPFGLLHKARAEPLAPALLARLPAAPQ